MGDGVKRWPRRLVGQHSGLREEAEVNSMKAFVADVRLPAEFSNSLNLTNVYSN
jgi:hypothetical protein